MLWSIHIPGFLDLFQGLKLHPMLNVGIHLSTLEPQNGRLRILPGTHKQGLYGMRFRKKHFLDHHSDPNEVAIIPQAGDLTVHDGRLWHRIAQSSVVGEEKSPPGHLHPPDCRQVRPQGPAQPDRVLPAICRHCQVVPILAAPIRFCGDMGGLPEWRNQGIQSQTAKHRMCPIRPLCSNK